MTDTSLLAAPSPDAISELFRADPRTLSDSALTSLVHELRRRRNAFAADEAATAAKGKKANPRSARPDAATAAALDKPIGETSLEDLLK